MSNRCHSSSRLFSILAALAFGLLLVTGAAAAGERPEDDAPPEAELSGPGPWVVRVTYENREQVHALAGWADIWAVYPRKGYILVQVDRPGEHDRLRAEGFEVKLDRKRTNRLRQVGKALKNQTSGIPGYPCYRTVEETFATAETIVTDHPDLATWTDVGDSWEKTDNPVNGYDMKVLRLTQSAVPGPKPAFFASCSIHAREYTTAELCTRFAELLVDGYGVDPDVTWLLDDHEVHLMLHTNPDGRKRAETGLSWRKNTNNDYCSNTNSRGADLNRNFDFQWGCCGGSSGSECSSTYRGAAPASEPEIQALQAYVRSIFPDQRDPDLAAPAPDDATGIAIDIHSHGELVLWSWGFTPDPPPNGTQLQTLGRKLAYFNGHEPKQGYGLYPTDGSSKDFYYGDLGIAAFVFELGTEFFESCVYFETNILQQNLDSLLLAAKVVRTPYLTPAGPETLAAAVPPRAFTAADLVLLTATVDDTRYSTRLGTEPSQTIAGADYFVDVAPWEAGAVPLAMVASDGTFEQTAEGVEATIDTTGLAVGRHVLYVRGTDADANEGVVSAVFLHLIDPVVAPTIQGTVRDADSLAPLESATVTAGGFETTTDAGGFYSMQVPAGTYDVTVVVLGYQSATAEGVVAADTQTITQDFDLPPFAGIWVDDAEGGNPGWTADAPWAITTEAAFSPTRSWTDSSGTLYGNNVDASLSSPVFDLQSYTGVNLSFRHIWDLEQGFDFGRVEISTDGGSNWTEVAVYTGTDQTASWQLAQIALPALDGAAQARIRFRLETDDSVQEDGWHLDDILLRGVFSGNNPPSVTITAPADGAAFDVGESITFTGIASDVEDGDLSASLAWTSSLDGAIGTGATFQTATLSEGLHTITAEVVDSGSASDSDTIGVKVGGCAVEVDFDDGGAAGWLNSPSSTCSTGDFVVATPTEVVYSGVVTQVGGDHTSGTGNAFFSAINTAAGTNDVDGGVCIVESPVYPLAKASDVSIWYFHGQRDAGDDSGDFFELEISTDGGSNWSTLAAYGDVTVNAAWTEATTTVPAGSDVKFRVRVADGSGPGDLVEGGVDDVLICATAPECDTDPDCDDGLYCNGVETCNAGTCEAGTPIDCGDGVSCTVDSCNEATDACESVADDGLCGNGLYCDGAETCDEVLDCQAGIPVDCNDDVACTDDACNEVTDACDNLADDGLCGNGLYCDGAETCDELLGCQAGTPVDCNDGVSCTDDGCNETTDVCDNLANDGLCDNGLYCDGAETCDLVLDCQAGSDPCPGQVCDEDGDLCTDCVGDPDCDDGLFCNGAETCSGGSCVAGTDPCPGQTCDEVGDQCVTVPVAQLEWGTVPVGSTAVTVTLSKTYFSPVVVTSIQYAANTTPVVTRISNLSPTSFDVRLQNPSGGAVAFDDVSYLVVEEGTWTVAGVTIEAQTYTSTVTDENSSWVGEAQSYGQSYTSPVVLGQVMSTTDPAWSVFWNQGTSRTNPPSATALVTGKTVCEDPATTRADETVGFVVFEAGHGTIGGIEFEAAVGVDLVRGITNSPPYTYTFNTAFASAPTVAVVTMAGVDGGNGGWAYTYGSAPATATTLDLAIDEDQVNDTERNHTPEQVAYVVFASSGVYP